MPLPRVAVLDDYQQAALRSADWGPVTSRAEVTVFTAPLGSPDETAAALEPFTVIAAMRERTPFPAALLDRLPQLRLLVTTGMRNASIDLPAAQRQGVTVCGTGGSAAGTPELTWALMMALTRSVAVEDARIRAGGWQSTVGRELAGRTLGLLGLGRIGARVAGYGRVFGMDVLAWSQNLTADRAEACGARLVDKAGLFRESDVVSVHVQLSDRTRGLVGAAELALLGPDGYLVNTSRGPIVDETALLAALHGGTIAGAGLDVFGTEPLPGGHPLRSAPRTVLTPHLGYVTDRGYEVFFADTVEDIVAWLDGVPVRVLRPDPAGPAT
jgi:phosphoglycerate dehydrogenase-like enzyme